ncbi:hypothetical protein DSO57_1017201 [Entomophthora muscae]|uniref:Uncharacterized protein n=1 Tax=Entomophthora muscae TaxID=34485 RepID=A0ACC2T4T2_9FUNG|nr:hypothetical protein DSO57_1017201 [Entomophthora muscae]
MRSPIESSITTDRTRLSGAAVSLIQQVAEVLKGEFLPFIDWVLPALLKLPTRTNKVVVTRATNCILTITKVTQLTELIPFYSDATKSISKTLRVASMKAILQVIESFKSESAQIHGQLIEASIRDGAIDSASEVREASRLTYAAYVKAFPDLKASFDESLSEVARKYLLPKPASKTARSTASFKKFMAQKPRSDSPVIPASSLKSPVGSIKDSDLAESGTYVSPASPLSSSCQTPLEAASQSHPCDLATHCGEASALLSKSAISDPSANIPSPVVNQAHAADTTVLETLQTTS